MEFVRTNVAIVFFFQEMIEVRTPLTEIAATPRIEPVDNKFTYPFSSKVNILCSSSLGVICWINYAGMSNKLKRIVCR